MESLGSFNYANGDISLYVDMDPQRLHAQGRDEYLLWAAIRDSPLSVL